MKTVTGLLIVLTLALIASQPAAQAGGVVGDGSPTSCTEDAFRAALAGGGTITFNCGASPVTIPIMFPNDFTDDTVIDGGGLVTLDGRGSTQLFIVNPGVQLELRSITLAGGSATRGGAVHNNGGTLKIFDSTLINNAADVLRDPAVDGRGGAIFNDGGDVTAVRTKFIANRALHHRWQDGTGGALYSQGGSLLIRDSQFVANVAGSIRRPSGGEGGAIAAQDARLDVQHTIFALNSAGWSGGAIWMKDSTFQYVDNTANYNVAGDQGGAVHAENSSGAFLDSTFENNRADDRDGGALHLIGGYDADTGQHLIANVGIRGGIFAGNRASGRGGAIRSTGTLLNVFQTRFFGNRAGFGGAIQIDEAFIEDVGELYADEVEFRNNTASGSGGAVALGTRNTTIIRSLFYRNTSEFVHEAWLAPGGGGAVYVYNGNHAVFQNTTFSFNIAERGGALFVNEEGRSTGSADVIYSTFYRNRAFEDANAIYGSTRIFAHNLIYTAEGAGGRNCNKDHSAARGELSYQYPSSSCGDGIPVIDPLLEPLADNGGFTYTHDFRNDLAGTFSEAIDRIPPGPGGTCDYDTLDDQRREVRPFDALGDGVAACDLGAVETRREFGPATGGLVEVTRTPTPQSTPTTVPTVAPTPQLVQCDPFRSTSPRDGMANGLQQFYWDPAPGASDYRLLIFNEQNALVGSYETPAPNTSLTADVGDNVIGGGFQFTYEVQALLNGQVVCTDRVTLLREARDVPPPPSPTNPPPPPGPVCGNGICEQGENPNNCQADCP